ncbi:MAG: hypothetical protein K9N21_21880 [Deltaproteobacteria bacterium]|nr:hypothetical protein [Deltaproteobacteria bacterium]
MESPEIQYVLDQACAEIEHARSWPTKVMAFYVAINFGLVGALIALRAKTCSFSLPPTVKWIVTVLLIILALWVVLILLKNHKNYLMSRNLQILVQQKFLAKRKEELALPDDWFQRNEVCGWTRVFGWGLYVYIVLLVTALVIVGIWVIPYAP